MQSFADICLKKGDGLSANIYDGLKDQKVIDAVIESAKSGGGKKFNIHNSEGRKK